MIARLMFVLSFTTFLAAQPADLVVKITNTPYGAEERADVIVEVETKVPLTDPEQIDLDINILGGMLLESWSAGPGITCVEKDVTWLDCAIAPLTAGTKSVVTMKVRTNGLGHVTADLLWRDRGFREEQRFWRKDLYRYVREFVVTNTGDAGAGSLRQAILDSNTACNLSVTPCLIRFELGTAATIRPVSPLPSMTAADVVMDGNGQVTLDGSAMIYPANGLHAIHPANVVLRNLVIQRFPENGVEVANSAGARIESCLIRDNGSRGVTGARGYPAIYDSVITGNRRSGVFVENGGASVIRSVVSANGASGVYVGTHFGARIIDSVIADNAHFGVATLGENFQVDVNRTRITGNALGQIDINLDGPSYFVGPEPNGYQPPNGPTLMSATYDPSTGDTTVRGKLELAQFDFHVTYDLQFYATTAVNEAGQYLGAIHITKPDFVVTFPGDLRGGFVTANAIRWLRGEFTSYRGTSELSTAIEVTTQ